MQITFYVRVSVIISTQQEVLFLFDHSNTLLKYQEIYLDNDRKKVLLYLVSYQTLMFKSMIHLNVIEYNMLPHIIFEFYNSSNYKSMSKCSEE